MAQSIVQGVETGTTTSGVNTVLLFSYTFADDIVYPFFIMVVARRTSGATVGDGFATFQRGFTSQFGGANRSALLDNVTKHFSNSMSDCTVTINVTWGAGSNTLDIIATGPTVTPGNVSWAGWMIGSQNTTSRSLGGGGAKLQRIAGEASTADNSTWVDVTWKEGATVNLATVAGKVYTFRAHVRAYRASDGTAYSAVQCVTAHNVTGGGTIAVEGPTNPYTDTPQVDVPDWIIFGSITDDGLAAGLGPDGVLQGRKFHIPASTGADANVVYQSANATATGNHVGSIWMRGIVGGEELYLHIMNQDASINNFLRCVLTTSWQQFQVVDSFTAFADDLFVEFGYDGFIPGLSPINACDIEVGYAQVEEGAVASTGTAPGGLTIIDQDTYLALTTDFTGSIQAVVTGNNIKLQVRGPSANPVSWSAVLDAMLEI